MRRVDNAAPTAPHTRPLTVTPLTVGRYSVAIVGGVLFGIIALVIGGVVADEIGNLLPLAAGFVVFVLCVSFSAGSFWYARLLWRTEQSHSVDIDGDGYIGRPGHDVRINNGATITLPNLDVSDSPTIEGFPDVTADELIDIINRGKANGLSFRQWQGSKWSRDEWAQIRQALVAGGWAVFGGGNACYLRDDVSADAMIAQVRAAAKGAGT